MSSSNLRRSRERGTDLSHSLCGLGKQGHIEDVAIAKDYQGRKLGTLMIEVLDKISEQLGSYKVGGFSDLCYLKYLMKYLDDT